MRAEHGGPGFGGAVAVGDAHLRQGLLDAFVQRHGHRRRAQHDAAQRRQVTALQQGRLRDQSGEHGGHGRQDGDAVAFQRVGIGGYVERRLDHQQARGWASR
ncbi:hypothetical protein G6F57_022213 [Rhizopus arrhizus]|nr:hypothetical protein G6F57_022213 [Rhizopus arrhizus]